MNGIAEDKGTPISSRATRADARLAAMDGKLDMIVAKLAQLEAGDAAMDSGKPARTLDKIGKRLDQLMAGFEQFQANLARPDDAALAATLENLRCDLRAMDEKWTGLTGARKDIAAAPRFEAEKANFERILTGFRLVLRDLGQQAMQSRNAEGPPAALPAHPLLAPVEALQAGLDRIDLSPLQQALETIAARLDALQAGQTPSGETIRPNIRLEAEKVGFERILTGFRLVLRDLGQQAARADSKNEASSLLASLEFLQARLEPFDAPRLQGAMDEMRERLGALEAGLAARPQPPAHANALFEAEKVGLERLLTGFRLVLRDLSDRVQALEVAPPIVRSAEPAPVVAVQTPAASGPDSTDLPHFDPRKLDFIHLRTAMGLVLRQTGQSTEALDRVVARLAQAEAKLSASGGLGQGAPALIERLDELEARLLATMQPPVQPEAADMAMPTMNAMDIARDDNALEPARVSLRRLLTGYRFILTGLQREAADLRAAVDDVRADRAAWAVERDEARLSASGQAGAEGFLVGMAGLMKHLGTEIDRLQVVSAPTPQVGGSPDIGQSSAEDVEDELEEAIRRLNVLGSRMARAVESASPSPADTQQGGQDRLAHELRDQTAEFLAIGSALMAEIRKRA
ncbi:hypothetical protein GGD83_004552 [Rhodoblastus sphagnicola]|uniref:hypothetical protein n=1 Tax=Rhodoblastus sphagnicola TaxID=333368 RepID=UPI0011B0C697|nr:hypothetical protein [Rhodoblastus sphagnicola]MBB4200723.1 hypothetical protein [Rhodoblastus sphagnicola]